jgi:HlyD family secretion protein
MKCIVFLFLLLLTGCGGGSAPSVPTAVAIVRNFEVVVETIGTLDAGRSTIVSSSIGGERGKIIWLIQEGSRVEVGDQLILIDPTPFEKEIEKRLAHCAELKALVATLEQARGWEQIQTERQVASAKFDLHVSELDLLKLEKGDGPLELARLESVMQSAQREHNQFSVYLQDLEQLRDEGIISQGEVQQGLRKVDETKKALQTVVRQYETYRDFVLPSLLEKAKARVARSKLELDQTQNSVKFQIGKAEASLVQAQQLVDGSKIALGSAKDALAATKIIAPIPGMIVYREEYRNGERRKPRVGDTVLQNQPLLYLPDISSMVVHTFIREVDVHRVQVGTPSVTRLDAFPALAIKGKVSSIGVLAENRNRRSDTSKVFQVSIALEGVTSDLRPGMTARTTIQSSALQNVLCIPIPAVFIEGNGTYCYKKHDEGFEKILVVLGSQNDTVVEIMSGLDEGDLVSLIIP